MRHARPLALVAVSLLLMAAALTALSGCKKPSRTQSFADDGRAAEQTASASVSATAGSAAAGGSGTAGAGSASAGSGSGGSATGKLSSKDASALDAELSAIQSELDRLNVPSDSDFDSIESGLE